MYTPIWTLYESPRAKHSMAPVLSIFRLDNDDNHLPPLIEPTALTEDRFSVTPPLAPAGLRVGLDPIPVLGRKVLSKCFEGGETIPLSQLTQAKKSPTQAIATTPTAKG